MSLDTLWPEWMKQGRCWGSAPVPALREVVDRGPGYELLACGHKVLPAFAVNNAPLGSYSRTCGYCSEDEEPNPFFPPKGGQSHLAAKDICWGEGDYEGQGECPVRAQCRIFADQHKIRSGVWGGATQRERAQHEVIITWVSLRVALGLGDRQGEVPICGT